MRHHNAKHKRTLATHNANVKAPVVKLPPEEPAARDEGPRLIPFPPTEGKQTLEPPRVKHYLELAEKALRDKS